MRISVKIASYIAVAVSLVTAISTSHISDAAEPLNQPAANKLEVVQQLLPGPGLEPAAPWSVDTPIENEISSDNIPPAAAKTLADLVASQPQLAELSRELNCLAGAIYFESKSESLTGQLAVGRVIISRSRSGRFPNSYCGVVFQRSQFSFVRGGGMPGIDRRSRQWRNAVAIAQIAHAGTWRSPVEGALYFHARHVSPSWNRPRIAQLENHIFYR